MSAVRLPAAVLARASDVARSVGSRIGVDIDAEELLGGRAALLGLTDHGQISAGGATRLMAASDGWCALTLSRPDDVDDVPALLECDDIAGDPWPAITRRVHATAAQAFAARARLLGLPVGVLGETRAAPPVIRRLGERRAAPEVSTLLVADLSSMWAGPLCGQLLARAGASVVKVETAARPDGTRSGPAAFFDWMNNQKLSYAADFTRPDGLRRLLGVADVVIESSRPGALERHGLGPADVPGRAGRVWVRITGHGADGERAGWSAFGDDAAVSGGLVAGPADAPRFCADAISDPLTGLHAAAAVCESLDRGGGEVVELAMSAVAAQYAALPRSDEKPCTTAPATPASAPELGADNLRLDRLVDLRHIGTC